MADEALVVSYDFLSPFVSAGFHAMKILIGGEMPAPYADRAFGAIGLGDGAAFAVVAPDAARDARRRVPAGSAGGLQRDVSFHRQPSRRASAWANSARGCRRPWATGPCGSRATARAPSRPDGWRRGTWANVSQTRRWSAGRVRSGHTLGSCGLVELAVAVESVRRGRAPGTVGTSGPCFGPQVACEAFDLSGFGGVVLNAFAFGGAHYACLLCHD